METNLDYVNSYYKVGAKVGQRVRYKEREGTIVCGYGQYIGVVLDGDKANNRGIYHPRDLEYTETIVKPPRMTASQQRYQRYLELGDILNCTFMEFLKRKLYTREAWE